MEEMEIVLIEDDEDAALCMLKFLKATFTNNIRYIQDGQRAAEYLLFNYDKAPKLILLDIFLPYMDGTELFEIIRNEPESKKLFVMFLVNDESAIQYIEGLGLKPDGYLKKAKKDNPPVRM
jgi:DNA-binding response OmpR family regulator